MKKVELLAPAGGYETMVGAFNAGADAVYLGGSKFGARAYADNFDREQVLDAVSYAHLHGKKIYMTVNTLVKEREFGELYGFMLPFAEKKLDGVIVQDFGVMSLIRREFPEIELHASTQQTVTGVYGAKLLKELGCCRVVPARELSLNEMKAIREKADIEVEAFIHGAMCYCYSGACLFSSMVGTRSGNRGRCAQPCRLPYAADVGSSKSEQYPLSLKDMCTIDMIPELIEAGIDSFKIEGRMKKPEYSAGVTSLYRKYIDLYYKNPDVKHEVSRDDMDMLKSLYLRTGISAGYYHKHNGKEMVTIDSPAYNGTKDEMLSKVREAYLGHELKIKCDIFCKLHLGEKAELVMNVQRDDDYYSKTVESEVAVQAASKRPMDEDSVRKQLERLGNTPFEADSIEISIDDKNTGSGIFVPVSELNELRRKLCESMTDEIEAHSKAMPGEAQALTGAEESSAIASADSDSAVQAGDESFTAAASAGLPKTSEVAKALSGAAKALPSTARTMPGTVAENSGAQDIHVLVRSKEQLAALRKLLQDYAGGEGSGGQTGNNPGAVRQAGDRAGTQVGRIYVESDILLTGNCDELLYGDGSFAGIEMIAALPYVTREEKFDGTKDMTRIAEMIPDKCQGVLVRNLEQLGFLKEIGFKGKVILDYGVYNWNAEAARLFAEIEGPDGSSFVSEICVPYELTIHEAYEAVDMIRKDLNIPISYNVYGRVPMMISAGCIKKTLDRCSGKQGEFNHEYMHLTDRMGNKMPVTTDCRNCYNIIWNANPTILYNKMEAMMQRKAFDHYRIDLTVESENEAYDILKAGTFLGDKDFNTKLMQKLSYTTGHYKRGVE